MSYRPQLIAIISIAQHPSPNVTGQIDDRRAHWTIFSTEVVRTGISASRPMCQSSVVSRQRSRVAFSRPDVVAPIEYALSPNVDVTSQEEPHEQHHLREPCPS